MFYVRSNNKTRSGELRFPRSARSGSQGVVYEFLQDYSRKWVQCSYCGRSIMFSDRTRHTRIFHTDVTGGLIVDWG
jgi:DNA-directed RNA polymerase subunit RPC12/RpoP